MRSAQVRGSLAEPGHDPREFGEARRQPFAKGGCIERVQRLGRDTRASQRSSVGAVTISIGVQERMVRVAATS
jgi:hypothetical protein